MFQKARESTYLESSSLLFLLLRWRKPLIITFLVALVASYIFSSPYFIKPKYKSSVVFFPSATNSVSKALLEESSSEKQDILAFGEEEQAEQMLQILNSDEIRETIIGKYDLLNHYGISASDSYPLTKLNEKFKDNISFSRTEFMSVRIDVLDTDPQMAANIANDIASLLDSMKTKIQRSRAEAALLIVKSAYDSKIASMNVKEDSLKKICEMGVMDFTTQVEILNKEFALASNIYANEKASLPILEKYKSESDTAIINTKARIDGANARIKNIQTQLQTLTKYGGASVSLNEELKLDREELAKIKTQYSKLNVDASQNLSPKFIVNKAVKAEKKSYPVRWLIVVVSVVLAFILSMVVLLIIERAKEIKYNL
jgi:uncharacterized protein involved in exopolysaccharide biosynthesis